MRKNTYISKTAGLIVVTTDENCSVIQAGALEARSLSMEKLDVLTPEYTRLLGTQENVSLFMKGDVWTSEEVSTYLQNEQLPQEHNETAAVSGVF